MAHSENGLENELGFSLVEMAIGLMILGWILSISLPAATQAVGREPKRQTIERMARAKEALTGFLVSTGRFPCPSDSSTKLEETLSGNYCSVMQGFLPAQTLGIQGIDGWGNVLRYAVTPAFAQGVSSPAKSAFTLETEAGLSIINPSMLSTDSKGAKAFAVILFSTGAKTRANSVDEQSNLNGLGRFIQKNEMADFDDVVESISGYSAKALLLTVGRLP